MLIEIVLFSGEKKSNRRLRVKSTERHKYKVVFNKTEGPLCQDNECLINSHVRMKNETNRIGPLPSELYTCKSSQLIFPGN